MIITIGVNLTTRPGGTTALYNLPETKNNSVAWKSTQKIIYSSSNFLQDSCPYAPTLGSNQGDTKGCNYILFDSALPSNKHKPIFLPAVLPKSPELARCAI